MHNHTDILVIGSGAAGLTLALATASQHNVTLVSKSPLVDSTTQQAQGGIATVISREDSFDSHIQDTIKASAGLAHPDVVRFTVENARHSVDFLIKHGVKFSSFDEDKKAFHLHKEGGHSHRRILHVADKTGAVIVDQLSQQALNHPKINCLIEYTVIDLIVDNQHCLGAYVLDNQTKAISAIFSKKTVLATGGASFVYLHTSNPERTTGDGIGMAHRAGCRLANMEFMQFHPTFCYTDDDSQGFLISEALRGEGAKLELPNGTQFMQQYDERSELAPRDIVARAIHHEMQKHQLKHVYLNASHLSEDFIKRRFPTIDAKCLKRGIHLPKERIPVVPSAHYTCGGVMTDLNGKTDVENLYAIGEVAFTGLHGANRMASNSLLECLVFAKSGSQKILNELNNQSSNIEELKTDCQFPHKCLNEKEIADISQIEQQLREIMWSHVGIIRHNQQLLDAQTIINKQKEQIETLYQAHYPNKALIECRNLLAVANAIVQSALLRKESRGLHYNADYPNCFEKGSDTIYSS